MSKANRHIVPVHVEEVWPYMRDHAVPTTPYAAEQLAKCRTYEPPSKAHIKRLKRQRFPVLVRKPVPPRPSDAARLAFNHLDSYAKATKALILRDRVDHAHG